MHIRSSRHSKVFLMIQTSKGDLGSNMITFLKNIFVFVSSRCFVNNAQQVGAEVLYDSDQQR